MKFLKCLLFIIVPSIMALEITEFPVSNAGEVELPSNVPVLLRHVQPIVDWPLDEKMKIGKDGKKNYFAFQYKDMQGPKERRWYKEGEKYWSSIRDLPYGEENPLYYSPREAKRQYDSAQLKFKEETKTVFPDMTSQSLLAKLALSEKEYAEAKTALEKDPSSRSNINK